MKLNECPSEHSSYGLHCSCIRQGRSSHQCCRCGHVVRKYERRNQMIQINSELPPNPPPAYLFLCKKCGTTFRGQGALHYHTYMMVCYRN